MTRHPTLDIIIVDFNAGEFVQRCVESLDQFAPHGVNLERVVIVDNASTRPTADYVGNAPLPITVVRNTVNRGFAAACNQGARGTSADYLLFLNPDTEVAAGSLDIPVAFMERVENADVGIAGIQLVDEEGRISRTCSHHPRPSFFLNKALGLERMSASRFPTGMMLDWDHATTRPVDNVIGAFFLVRRSVFESLAGFDERFFVYFEETDFGKRAAQAGFRTMYLTDARAFHRGCGSTDSVRARRLVYSMRSRMEYARLHFSRRAALLVCGLTLFVEPVTRVLHALMRGALTDVRETLQAYRELWRGHSTTGSAPS